MFHGFLLGLAVLLLLGDSRCRTVLLPVMIGMGCAAACAMLIG